VRRGGAWRRSWWWWVAGLAFALSIAIVLMFAARLPAVGLERADKLASVGSLVTSAAGLLLGGIALWMAVRHDAQKAKVAGTDEATLLDQAANELADAVRRQWEHEARLRQLRQPRPLRVRWSTTLRPVSAQPAAVLGEGIIAGRPTRLKLHGDLYGVVAAFRQLPARQLVVLGEPGAGKTVLAMLFTLDLLNVRMPDEPVPVLLSISSWNPLAEHLDTWLARRLVEDYPALANTDVYGPDVAPLLVRHRRLIPILDGLDEMSPAMHGAAIKSLDRALAKGGPLVVTCRSDEYQTAVAASGRFLSRAAVVEIEPINVTSIIEFLTTAQTAGDTRWRPIFEHLRAHPGGALTQALSTPLMVYLARIAYANPATTPAELCDRNCFPNRITIEEHLLDAYLPSVYGNQPRPLLARDDPPITTFHPYSLDQVQRWLTFVAGHLQQQQTRDLAWWQLHHALPYHAKKWVGGFVIGLVDGLICALGLRIGIGSVGIAAGSTGGLTAALVNALMTGPPAYPRQVNTQLRERRRQGGQRFFSGIMLGLGVGIVVGISVGISIGIIVGVTIGLGVGITAAIAIGILGGLSQWLHTPADVIRSLSPASVLRSDRTISILSELFGVFGIALAVGLSVAAVGGVRIGITTALMVGLIAGLVGGCVNGLADRLTTGLNKFTFVGGAWGWFLVSRWWLALANKVPWRLMTFLNDAHQRGVLRQAGAVYQFRHTRLQDHLANVAATSDR
jgi:NACHT domain